MAPTANDGHGKIHDKPGGESGDYMPERRHRPPAALPTDLLQEIPARVLLDRMPTPTIGLANDGAIVYANPACASMLGYPDAAAILEQTLPALLAGHADGSQEHCLAMLRDADGKVVDWTHTEGYAVHTAVSSPLLLRAGDPLLLITLTDVTELLWEADSRGRRP